MSSNKILKDAGEKLYPLVVKNLCELSQKRYNDEKWTLKELNTWKVEKMPKIVKERNENGKAYINKHELVLLMQWKLAFGKFRPTLPKLIASNNEKDVEEASHDAFQSLLEYASTPSKQIIDYQRVLREALKKACILRGVGPATGSLMLSLLSEVTDFAPPFFSDECFMYIVRDALRPGAAIKYNVKEYVDELIPVLYKATEGTTTTMEFLQRGAWALKSYEMLRLTSLSDIELPFDVEESALYSFPESEKLLKEENEMKRKAEPEPIKAKKKRK